MKYLCKERRTRMRKETLKTVCSVIQDGWHYKGNRLYFEDNRLCIQGIYPCEIQKSSVVACSLKRHLLFSDLCLTIGTFSNQEELIIRIPNANKARFIAQSIEK